jgi:hypothetical protein
MVEIGKQSPWDEYVIVIVTWSHVLRVLVNGEARRADLIAFAGMREGNNILIHVAERCLH